MRKLALARPYMLVVMVILVFSFLSAAEQPKDSPETRFVKQYLQSINKSVSFDSGAAEGKDYLFIGQARPPLRGWRVIVVHGAPQPHVLWDSLTLHDPYLSVTGLGFLHVEDYEDKGYVVTIRGCVPHQCADGKIGFAVYASRTRQTYIAHVLTNEDGSYRVTYYPTAGIPKTYREQLEDMICSDNGISRPSALPIHCPHAADGGE